jgi:hypothetical protein
MHEEISYNPDWPDELDQKVAELGEPVVEFTVDTRRVLTQLVLAPLMFLGGLVLILGPVWVLLHGRPGGAALFKLIVLGLLLTPGAIALCIGALRKWGLRVLVFPEGLVRAHRGKVQAVFWEEIQTINQQVNVGAVSKIMSSSLVFVVQRASGEELHFDGYLPDLKKLGAILQRETLRHLLPRALAVYQRGEPVAFGKLQVSRAGISNGKDTLPWSEVKEVKVEESSVSVSKEGKWWTWYTAVITEVPNAHVFQALAQLIQSEYRRDKTPPSEEVQA